ncbi:MAG: hypothetical protein ACRD7E_31080, partial [Bryobacteraceae bacterium]
MRILPLLVLAAASLLAADHFPFKVAQPAEVIAELEMQSPDSDWAEEGREAAMAVLTLDRRSEQHVMLFAGDRRFTYRVFLGRLEPGTHELSVARSEEHSAPQAKLAVHSVEFRSLSRADPDYEIIANAPVLFARQNTIRKFTDIPLLAYCERLQENGKVLLQYTVIFSNEDGGTSTRALMARWGRTTDIEYLYKVYLDSKGNAVSATVQGRDHQELEFAGKREGAHPLLIPVTDNNMVSGEAASSVRYQLVPVLVDMAAHSREQVMDDNPITYQVMTKELIREDKLRPFAVEAGEKTSDPRNYAFFEYKAENTNAALAITVRLKTGKESYSSFLGRLDYAIARN